MDSSLLQKALVIDLNNARLQPKSCRYYAAKLLQRSLCKKYIEKSSSSTLADIAVKNFDKSNNFCRDFKDFDSLLVAEMRRRAESDFQTCPDWQELLNYSGILVGSGSSVGSKGRNTLLEKLLHNKLSVTSSSLGNELLTYLSDDFSIMDNSLLSNYASRLKIVESSITSTVPKSSSTDRTICTEPSVNMIFQRSLAVHIDKILEQRYGYDPALQPDNNRRLAKEGSIHDSLCTIDLSNASDTISVKLCSKILPRWLYLALLDSRCHSTRLPDGRKVPLHMISSMGNGFTFSLETYIFTLVCASVASILNVKLDRFSSCTNFGVFGDDIIVPSSLYQPVCNALLSLGFQPNLSKSYYKGYFRESCGSDWYNGINIRGVYIRRLESINDRYSAVNRLIRWSSDHFISLPTLVKLIMPKAPLHIPHFLNDDQGLKSCPPQRNSQGLYPYSYLMPLPCKVKNSYKHTILTAKYACCMRDFSRGLDRRAKHTRYKRCTQASPAWYVPNMPYRTWEFFYSLSIN